MGAMASAYIKNPKFAFAAPKATVIEDCGDATTLYSPSGPDPPTSENPAPYPTALWSPLLKATNIVFELVVETPLTDGITPAVCVVPIAGSEGLASHGAAA